MHADSKPLVLVNALKLHQGPERLPTGNFQHVLHLAEELARLPEIDVRLLTDLDSHGPLAERINAAQLVPTALRGNSILAADRMVLDLVRRLRPDIYHRPTGQLPFRHLPCRTVAGVADLSFMVLPHPLLKRLYKELSYRWTAWQADRIVCVSEFTARDVIARLAVVPTKVRVVHHGANALPAPDPVLARRQGGRYFMAFAHQTHKNAELCLRALAQVQVTHPGLRLVLIGKNSYVDGELKSLAARLGLAAHADFVGAPNPAELSGLYREAAGLLFPSRFEGFGLPVLEAMQAGCPVISSNACSLPEIVGDAAIQVGVDDDQALAAAMRRLLNDLSVRTRLAVAGRERIRVFTWRRAAEATRDIYLELFNERTR